MGLPLGGNPKACGFWDPVIERISRRLDGWQKAFSPQWQQKLRDCKEIFLWSRVGEGKRDHLVSWDVVYNPKAKGVILSIYGSHSNGWDANTIVRWSHRCLWKAIAQVSQEFSKFTRFVVGDGERIRFWEDLWWGTNLWGSNIQDYLE
ncbi:hypothetical protein CK203_055212 [Vitis vinifera]|uniref:Uncharacterized protein n=1 Tax=Vitis vinifera TaxID=29760 RepID=A0A438GHS5_VITVI|nr:hypothetical protein CK203_055212 [Vitis vinifera]